MEGSTFENSVTKTTQVLAALEAQARENKDRVLFPAGGLESLSRILLKKQIGRLQLLAIACGGSHSLDATKAY